MIRCGNAACRAWLAALICLFVLMPDALATDHVTPAYYQVVEEQIGTVETIVNVRARPSTSSDVVAKIHENETCAVLGVEGDWYQVEKDGKSGYVLKEFLTVQTVQREIPGVLEDPLSAQLTDFNRPYLLEYLSDYRVSGVVKSNIPLMEVRVDIYDLRELAVERAARATFKHEDKVQEFDLNRISNELSFKRLNPGEKQLVVTAISSNDEMEVNRTLFYVFGQCKEPVSMTRECKISLSHGNANAILDYNRKTSWTSRSGKDYITLEIPSDKVPAALSLEWKRDPKDTKIVLADADGNEIKVISEENTGMMVRFYDLDEGTRTITISSTDEDLDLCELRVYEKDHISPVVQRWEPTPEKLDMMIIVAHQDDEVLFMGGSMSFAALRGKKCAVVWMAGNYRKRLAEALDCLWTSGVHTYPIFLHYVDEKLDNYAETERHWQGALSDLVEVIRRYKPDVIVTHDIFGEYGHNQHKLTCAITQKAVEIAADGTQETESAQKWGAWNTPKLYIHLYPDNRLTLPWDEPEAELDGFTINQWAYAAFEKHWSQRGAYSMDGVGKKYDNTCFGLARSTVGLDVAKDSFFENLN